MNVEGASTSAEPSKYLSKGTTRSIVHTIIDAFVTGKDESNSKGSRLNGFDSILVSNREYASYFVVINGC